LVRLDLFLLFRFTHTATTEIYTLSLHDALPICVHQIVRETGEDPASSRQQGGVELVPDRRRAAAASADHAEGSGKQAEAHGYRRDRKSTRLNSSHLVISYAVFCLKKKKKKSQKNKTFTKKTEPQHNNTKPEEAENQNQLQG